MVQLTIISHVTSKHVILEVSDQVRHIFPVLHSYTRAYYTPWHLCGGVYSFRLSVRPFVCSYVRSFVRTSFRHVEFASKFCVKVSQVVYISATTHQKAFIFGP